MPLACDPCLHRFDPPLRLEGSGPLSGLSAAVKDNFDINGWVTGNGSPEWAATHPPATRTGTLLTRLMEAGLTLTAKAQMDEMAWSILGANARYGTPANPAAPGRLPGGSSSGPAVMVAAGTVDIGIGSDTGGSVRVPASFTGVIGLRPTHGSLPDDGLIPFAPSYDTPGFFTRDAGLMAQVLALAGGPEGGTPLAHLRAPADLWALADPDTVAALEQALPPVPIDRSPLTAPGRIAEWFDCFRLHQAGEVWQTHGAWVSRTRPAFGPGIAERFAAAEALSDETLAALRRQRADIAAEIRTALGEETVLLIPSAPGPAPRIDTGLDALDAWRTRAISLLCVAGHAGLPQISLPVSGPGGLPVGLGLVGPQGSDARLIATATVLGLA